VVLHVLLCGRKYLETISEEPGVEYTSAVNPGKERVSKELLVYVLAALKN
jgi:hypothetical protein